MKLPAPATRFDADQFLAWEAGQPEKHEYLAGEVFAMAGASDAHVTTALNVAIALRNHLRGGPCSVYIADMKLRIEAEDAFFYPDVFVTCSAADRAQPLFKNEPTLVVEVLSPSTSAYDRGAKFAAYRKLLGLQEYVLVDPERASVDVFRREGEGRWVLVAVEGLDGSLELASVGLVVPMAVVFEDVAGTSTASAHM